MDQPDHNPESLRTALRELSCINRYLNGPAPSLKAVDQLTNGSKTRWTMLDVGTGAGDLPPKIIERARNQGKEIHIHAIDLLPEAIEYAQSKYGQYHNISFETRDLFELPEEQTYDIVHAAKILHHFHGNDAVQFLSRLATHARHGVIIVDLHRHPMAYYGIRVITRMFATSPMIRHDGPLSVLRGFRREELQKLTETAGFPSQELTWCPFFRWQLVGKP